MGDYQDDPIWADVVPIPQDDGGPNPLAAISYTEGYAEAMSYLRAVMAANELSERALDLTEDIISMNPAHYTVWLYRVKILTALSSSLREEIEWLNAVALAHQKNYQIWHHRQFLLDRLNDPACEIAFINQMLAGDAKNYHVWSYRQWLVRRFGLWETKQEHGRRVGASLSSPSSNGGDHGPREDDDSDEAPELAPAAAAADEPEEATELDETAWYIAQDVRNNSAWNHRFFIVHGPSSSPAAANAVVVDPTVYAREVSFAQAAVRLAPQNQSPWNYLRGVAARRASPREALAGLEGFCREFVEVLSDNGGQGGVDAGGKEGDDERWGVGRVRSSHALELLAEMWAGSGDAEGRGRAEGAYRALGERWDPIRVGYWEWLRGRLARRRAGEGAAVGRAESEGAKAASAAVVAVG